VGTDRVLADRMGDDDGVAGVGHCPSCGEPLAPPKRASRQGRPREYCSPKCVSRAWWKRKKSLDKWLTEMGS
jgi:hypothetical protein